MSAGPSAERARIRSRKPGAKRSTCVSIRSVMSTAEPFGTWLYAQAVCRPSGDLVERGPEVDRRRASALLGPPGDRPVERPVELEHARPVAVPLQPSAIPSGEAVAGEREKAARRQVKEHRTRLAQLGERLDLPSGFDLAAERAEVRGERIGDPLRSASRERPAERMREQSQRETERC